MFYTTVTHKSKQPHFLRCISTFTSMECFKKDKINKITKISVVNINGKMRAMSIYEFLFEFSNQIPVGAFSQMFMRNFLVIFFSRSESVHLQSDWLTGFPAVAWSKRISRMLWVMKWTVCKAIINTESSLIHNPLPLCITYTRSFPRLLCLI